MPVRLLVIIPAFNEQDALGGLLTELQGLTPTQLGAGVTEIALAVVDDGSVDRTAAISRAHGARTLQLCANLGIGGAVQTGIALAHREGFDAAVQIDGDGQHPPAELAALLAKLGDADVVVGTRFGAHANRAAFRSTLLRRIGIGWLRAVLRTFGVRASDPTSGFRVYGARALALFAATYPYDYPEPESLAVARARGLRVVDVPVAMRERQGGRSSIAGLSTAYYMWKVTVAVALAYLRARSRVERHA